MTTIASIDAGGDDLVMTFTDPANSGQDHKVIARSGGMRLRIVGDGRGGWRAVDNPRHRPRHAAGIERVMATAA